VLSRVVKYQHGISAYQGLNPLENQHGIRAEALKERGSLVSEGRKPRG
jgi:hypothetical protein